MITDINSEDRLVQRTFAGYLRDELRWESLYAWQEETFGPNGTLGRGSEREVVLVRDLRAALARLNPDLPESAHEQAVEKLTRVDFSRSLVQHNREFHGYIRRQVVVDPEIGDSDRIFVSYFTLCRQIHWEPMVLRFDQMPAAVYAKEYPVSVRFAVATGFRGKRGTHALRIDLVNAATRVSREVVRMDVESRSSSVVTELHGDLAFPIPEPGIYFVSLVINESRVATAILPAETPAAEWSYALRPEDTARVEGGELLALLRGSQTEEEAREARGQTSA
jgi:hypothetical protein